MGKNQRKRCTWVTDDPLYIQYHDKEWGVPVIDSKQLFAQLCLEGQQAGLSWITVLRKRDGYLRAFHDFDPYAIVTMTENELDTLAVSSEIIRSRRKIAAIVDNARAFIELSKTTTFSDFVWQFTDYQTQISAYRSNNDIPTSAPASKAMAKALKQKGFKYVGETICYAFMQAVGMVNDHEAQCYCYQRTLEVARR